jgi:transposase
MAPSTALSLGVAPILVEGMGAFFDRRIPMQLTHEDGVVLRQLQTQFAADDSSKSIFKFVFENAPDTLRQKFVNQKGEPSAPKAKVAVQALTLTTVVRVCLRPNWPTTQKFIEPNIAAGRYAQNFVTGTNRTLSWWNRLPEQAKKDFLVAYNETSWDDLFEDRVTHVEDSAPALLDHFQENPFETRLAELTAQLEEQLEAYAILVKAYEEGGKKGKRPKRPSAVAKETKALRRKAEKWKYRPELTSKKIGRFIRLHDQMRMLSEWTGSTTGRKPSGKRSYEYTPMDLQYPGAENEDGRNFGWNALLVCLLDERNLDRVIASGERLDLISTAYRQCMTNGVKHFTDANARYLKYLGQRKKGKGGRKVGPPQIKSDSHSFAIQSVSVTAGAPDTFEEGLSADGQRWEVRCNDCPDCENGKLCHNYFPALRVGGMRMALGKELAARGIRISRAEYRRIKKTCAYGGRLSEVIISRESLHRQPKGEVERTTKVTRGKRKQRKRIDCGPKVRYFASVVISDIPAPPPRKIQTSRVVGIDAGARKFLTFSDNTVIPDLQVALDPYLRERKKLQQRLSRWHDNRCRDKWRGKKYETIKRRYAEACDKVARMRRHLHEQVIDQVLEMPFDVLVLEDLTLANMTRSAKGTAKLPAAYGQAKAARERNRKMLAQGINGFYLRLVQRAKKHGKVIVFINPAYTSQTCHACKERHSELGSDETFVCPSCGHEDDRDRNAALNIRDKGIELLEEHGLPPVGGKYLCTEELG